ncbi:MAG: family 78 glycoside hydrolase catalytic domain [Planctomycetota bacterium]|jgi:hypothetical protein
MKLQPHFKNASWIWCNKDITSENQYALFRKNFELEESNNCAKLKVCADMRYWIYINGTRIGFGPGRFNQKNPQYDVYDVSQYLKASKNSIAAILHGIGEVFACSSFMPTRCAFIAELEADEQIIATDSSWQSIKYEAYFSSTPRFCNHQSFIECFDAGKEIRGWQEIDFDDSSWKDSFELNADSLAPWENFTEKEISHLTMIPRYPVRILESGRSVFAENIDINDMKILGKQLENAERLPDKCVSISDNIFPVSFSRVDNDGAYAVFDFGENSAGYLTFEISGDPGTIIDFGYSESFEENYVECFKQGVKYHDRIIVGNNKTVHQLMFPKTLRYLLAEVRGGSALLHSVKHEISTYPVKWRGGFYTDEEPCLSRIWQIGAHTVQICMEDIYMDTPRRERAGWLGDMLPEAIAAYYAFGDTELAKHSIEIFMSSQHSEGWISGRFPSLNYPNMPSWSACMPMIIYDYVMHSGDTGFAEKMWDNLEKLTRWFESQRTAENLLEVFPAKQTDKAEHRGYILIDWAPMERDGAVTAMNMLYCKYLEAMTSLAVLLDNDRVDNYQNLYSITKAAVNEFLFDKDRGCYVNCRHEGRLSTQAGCQENLLALLYNIAEENQKERIKKHLFKDNKPLPLWHNPDPKNWVELGSGDVKWEGDGLVPIGSPFFLYFALGAIFEEGMTDFAIATIKEYYGDLLARGATTVWEEWSGVSSQSHGWGAAPTWALSQYILGVRPLTPGFKEALILPDTGSLKKVSGKVPTPLGDIRVEIKKENSFTELIVYIPDGITATAGLPGSVKDTLLADGSEVAGKVVNERNCEFITTKVSAGKHVLKIESK